VIQRCRDEFPVRLMCRCLWQRQGSDEVILHSDRGSQFRSGDYQGYFAANGLICSMSAVRHCGDNAACEGFFWVAEARADLSNELPHTGCSKNGCV